MPVFENTHAYASAKSMSRKKVKVTFEIALDPIPGGGDEIEDHIQHIFSSNPYVVKATVER